MGKAGKMYGTNTKHVTRNCVIVNLEHPNDEEQGITCTSKEFFKSPNRVLLECLEMMFIINAML